MLRVSIAMCVRNGASFLPAQLESIAAQSRPADEMWIFDDCSTDDTASILRAAHQPGHHVVFNPRILGAVRNFEQAISACTGELIVLADQDDIWTPRKLERLESAFSDPGIALVFSNGELVDKSSQPIPGDLWSVTFPLGERRKFDDGPLRVLIRHNVVTGATMAFRASLRQMILPFPEVEGMMHDHWIATIAAGTSKLKALDEPLIRYRVHAGQAVGIGLEADRSPSYSASDYQLWSLQLQAVRDRLVQLGADAEKSRMLEEKIRHLDRRASVAHSRWRRMPIILRELLALRYHRYSNGFVSAAKDLWRRA